MQCKYVGTHNVKHSENEEKQLLEALVQYKNWVVTATLPSQSSLSPPLPLTTSALQQKAYSMWKWSPKRTMTVAQKLYEGGHITYMRTDCKVLAKPFIEKATAYLRTRFGQEYVGQKGSKKTSSKGKGKQAHAQEAHEPIRPVKADAPKLPASYGDTGGHTLYKLIYETTMASLMTPCVQNKLLITLHPFPSSEPNATSHCLKATCTKMHFPGYRVWEVLDQLPWTSLKPNVNVNDVYRAKHYESAVKYSVKNKPYTSGDLLKLMEANGVGRPSTYSSILETIETRNYVTTEHNENAWKMLLATHPLADKSNHIISVDMTKRPPKWLDKTTPLDLVKQVENRFNVTPLGTEVIQYLVEHLPDLIDAKFTAKLEEELDEIVQGEKDYSTVVSAFYETLCKKIAKVKPLDSKTNTGNNGAAAFVNGHARRVLKETDDMSVVAMQTRNGPAVALLYKDPKRKKESVFANISQDQLCSIDYKAAMKAIDDKKEHSEYSAMGHKVGTTSQGIDIYAKSGPYGQYLQWKDKNDILQRLTIPDKSVDIQAINMEDATEWMKNAQLTLHKVSALYTVKYNVKKDSVYLSKSKGKGKRGRPTYAPMNDYTKADIAKFKDLKIQDCDVLMEEAAKNKGKGKPKPRASTSDTKVKPQQPKKKKRSTSNKQKVHYSKKRTKE